MRSYNYLRLISNKVTSRILILLFFENLIFLTMSKTTELIIKIEGILGVDKNNNLNQYFYPKMIIKLEVL
jgi:hypothetical protein